MLGIVDETNLKEIIVKEENSHLLNIWPTLIVWEETKPPQIEGN